MRIFNTVFCDEQFEDEVELELQKLYKRLQVEHPDWDFDWGQGAWNEAHADDFPGRPRHWDGLKDPSEKFRK